MEEGNEVDLSNNNITPQWMRRCPSDRGEPRSRSYKTDGVDDRRTIACSQSTENILCSTETLVLKHTLKKPTYYKPRMVKVISIGENDENSDQPPLPKTKLENEAAIVDNQAFHTVSRTQANRNCPRWPGSSHPNDQRSDARDCISTPAALTSKNDQIVFGSSLDSPDHIWQKQRSPSAIRNCSHSPPSDCGAPTASGSTSDPPTPSTSCPSPMSCSTSDPPTPQSPSPEERGVLLRQASENRAPSNVVLSTNSPAALKLGTQQLIPKALASCMRSGKAAPGNHGNQGLLEAPRRAPRVRSMVEAGAFFSTSGDGTDETRDGADCSPGSLKRATRSTSYRRAVVSGIDLDVTDILCQPQLILPDDKERSPSPAKNKTLERKKGLPTQKTFDSEGDEVMYQNYQEKALHNDSDEEAEPRMPESDPGIVVQYRSIQTCWSRLSVVKKSGVCEKMTPEERKRQEAIFEVISSEYSYLRSLEVLIRMFKNSAELSDTMTKTENHHLFSNITDVCEASKKFFKELEDRHQQNFVIDDISDIMEKHARYTFDPYVTYCSNEVYQQRTLQKLLTKNPTFKEVLSRSEAHQDCRNLPMHSFLILPMQRVTRLPLLLDTICQKTAQDSVCYGACKKALQAVSKLVRQCNEGARRMERTEMMYTINSQLGFKIKPFPLVSSSRWLVKRGELTTVVEDNSRFIKRVSRLPVYLFLFNDVLIVTRKKSEESYTVMDYALRDQIKVDLCQADELNLSPVRTPSSMLTSRQPVACHLFKMRFCSNHSQEMVSRVLGAEQLNERARWVTALGQSTNDRKNMDKTELAQVEVTRTYTAKQPDELSLQVADVVLLWQTVDDGWYEGQRLRDGECGWFPAECAEVITCQATIQRNVQRMDRLQRLETNV
ncbi:rho guanine nucleotide exchange factor 26 [Paramormyrops kingsleyae]|uniref:Rho guanine nucleotide exchange factor 26 n=1 Tax=Paramormyrops kingsleyae TaxID=1676925 RepID=A0A3B3SEG4_9TELE|nr:rho guanine nucleotide exchange factor 26 [Paramormyrops kingsleyae]